MTVPGQDRTIGPPDPLAVPPRSTVTPNENAAVGSVGPNVPTEGDPSAQEGAGGGYGAQHVMYPANFPPLEASAWAGWASEWAVPTDGYGGAQVASDIAWRCIDLNGSAVASMPPTATRDGMPIAEQPSWLANPQPQVYSHWQEFVRQIWWSYQACGEVFIAATSRYLDSGYPRTFCMLNPWLVSVDIVDGIRSYSIGGQDANDDILHIRYSSWPGDARGHGPLEVARERLLAARVLMRYGSDLAANGGIPWAVLRHKYKLGEVQATELRQQWVAAARSRAGAPAVLDNDTELQQLQTTPKDMALSELQQFAEARIAVLLGVPPFLVALPSGADSLTYSTVSMTYDSHWRQTLLPHSRFIMGALSAWALPGRTNVELYAEDYIRPSPLDRANTYKIYLDAGVMTPDEVRRAERLPARTEAPDPMTDDPRTQIRSFRVDLEVADERTMTGLVVPYNVVAPITELRPDGVITYREQFVRGAFERATRDGNAGRVPLVYPHNDSLPNRLGYGLEFREADDGLYGTFRLDESTAAKARDVLTTSHSGLSISFLSLLPKAFTEKAGALITRAAAHLQHVAAVSTPAYALAGVTAIREGGEDPPSPAEIAAQEALDEQRRQLEWVDQLTSADPWKDYRV